MTSTSFNVGLNENRNSSRVLRPPGGGHSDIFGVKEDVNDVPKKISQSQRDKSSFFQDMKSEETVRVVETTVTETSGVSKQEITSSKVEVPSPVKATQPASAPRIPPGGFSSGGFW